MNTNIDFETILKVQKILGNSRINNTTMFYVRKGTIILEIYRDLHDADTYRTIEIIKNNRVYDITVLPERIKRTADEKLKSLEDIITIIEKQMNVEEYTQKELDEIKQKYVEGIKIELIKMYDFQAVPSGTKGTVFYVDSLGTVFVEWENGSKLGLDLKIDEFKII